MLSPASAPAQAPSWDYWNDPLTLARHRDDYAVVQYASFSPSPCAYGDDGMVLPTAMDCRYDHLYRPLGRHRELRNEGGELVLVDERGAGALVRAWMTTGDGFSADFPEQLRLRIRLDGNPVPYLDIAINDWFAGTLAPHLIPLVGSRHTAAGAGFNLLPIVFNAGLKISLAGSDQTIDTQRIWYQFNVQRVAADVENGPSGIPGDWPRLLQLLATPAGNYPWPAPLEWASGSHTLAPGETRELVARTTPGTLLALRLRVTSAEAWNTVRLAIHFDDGEALDHPLATWVGMGAQADEVPKSLLVGRDSSGFAYIYWPMPFHQRLRAHLRLPAGADAVVIDYAFALSGSPPPADAMRFGIIASATCLPAGVRDGDLPLLSLQGHGRWLGLSSRQHNQLFDNANYLEGDERIQVDGSPHPAWHGTGNEDFYNAGFYFDRGGYGHVLSLPVTGAPAHQLSAGMPVASRMYRLLLADSIPFHSRLAVRLERGAYGDQAMCAQTTAWYYHEPQRALVPVAELDLASDTSLATANYRPPTGAHCHVLLAQFADEPPTSRSGRVCRHSGGPSSFQFRLRHAAQRLWLRRRFDALEGGQAAQVFVNGKEAGRFPYAQKHPHRRWQEVTLPLAVPAQPATALLDVRIVPMDPGEVFTESTYTLFAPPGDPLFGDGFETTP